MRKILQMIFLFLFIFCFFSIKNVFAVSSSYEVTVCPTSYDDCMYTDINAALSDIEDGVFEEDMDDLDMFLAPGDYTLTKDYDFNADFYINYYDYNNDYNYFNISIDGNNHSLFFYSYFCIYGDKVTLSNISFHLDDDDYDDYFLYVSSNRFVFDSSSIIYDNDFRIYDYSAIKLNTYDAKITDVTISNFANAIVYGEFFTNSNYPYYSETQQRIISDKKISNHQNNVIGAMSESDIPYITIDQCDLSNNSFSLNGMFNGTISNTKLSSIFLLASLFTYVGPIEPIGPIDTLKGSNSSTSSDLNDIRVSHLILEDTNDYSHGKMIRMADVNLKRGIDVDLFDDILNDSIDAKSLYLVNEAGSVIELFIKKNDSINIQNTRSIHILDYFEGFDQTNISNYTFTVSDESVAYIENGDIVFLKDGDIDVLVYNRITRESYTLHLHLEKPINPKTANYLWLGIIVLILLSSTLFILLNKQKSTI